MFTNISWGNYLVAISLLLASWYLFIGLRFYFDDVKEIVTGNRKLQFPGLANKNHQEPQSELNHQDSHEGISADPSFGEFDTTFQNVDTLVEQLKNAIADVAKKKLDKQESLNYIQLILREHSSVKDSPFRSSVSELIVSECNKTEIINLTQDEAEGLWN